MKIEWVNHASFVVEADGISLICDPWIEGRVFNNSWAQVSPTVFSYNDFSKITHIWFSHEHPDHFYPPNIIKIPEEIRKKITVLYQKSEDRKVIEFCRKLGFIVIELEPLVEVFLNDTVSIINNKVKNESDSWLFFKSTSFSFLNLNDCVFENKADLEKISSKIGEIDILFTQFSYANWVGNADDFNLKNYHASQKLEEIGRNIDVFKPKYTVPFASYVWFCAESNFHMNHCVNSIDDVYKFLSNKETTPIVLYPGDIWYINGLSDSQQAIEKYVIDHKEKLESRNLTSFELIEYEDLKKSAETFKQRHLKMNDNRKLKSYAPFFAYLTDWNEAISFSYSMGLKREPKTAKSQTDIAINSQNLKYCFDHDWGWSTIMVAGTFEKPLNGNFKNVEEYQWISTLNNIGKRMDGILKRSMGLLKTKLKSIWINSKI
ncbi:MAG: MBL fold metallo-hydrolase [Bacteroidota bacterium]